MVSLMRTIHGLISFYFVSCIVWIYYSAISNHPNTMAYIAAASLLLEGLVVLLNHGDCPLGAIHHRLGDDKAFFELFLPKLVAKKAVPFLGVIALIGILVLFIF
jgi:hypothetical protein